MYSSKKVVAVPGSKRPLPYLQLPESQRFVVLTYYGEMVGRDRDRKLVFLKC